MNERIQELAEQASFLNKDEESIDYFARLLILKCSELIETRDPRIEPAPHIYLLKYFGVEE